VDGIPTQTIYIIMGVLALFGVGHHSWRRSAAEHAAQQWLRKRHYRVLELRTPWFRMARFAPSFFRNSEKAVDFEAIVEDTKLGGTARISMRVWTDWMAQIDGDIEVVVNNISSGEVAPPLFDRLAAAQVAVLRRIADGETAFYAPRRSQGGEAEFNELAEHVMALSRRGMITCGTPRMDAMALNYESIGDIALTHDGKSWLASQSQETAEEPLRTAD